MDGKVRAEDQVTVCCGLFLVPKLKSTLKGRRFQTVEEIKGNSLQDLHAIPRNTFQDAFRNWKKR
ncbi:hypothetical protein Cfor_05448 [Coptotermes formosanus]|uniref:Uncharacterized protein n=1 Tax=Coptotermes formosanus TaxID=36987 RepID=A0A6L2PWS0_COPFO|nr:hypothetical protein Cfor_05448 [Coptotermes formosanus]